MFKSLNIFCHTLRKVDKTMFPVFEKVKKKKNHSLGYGRNSLYSLKNKKPNAERLQEIADYFNVSTDYLLGRTGNPAIAKDGQEYNTEDLRKMAENAKTFDGKPLTESDIEAIQNIIEIYLKGR